MSSINAADREVFDRFRGLDPLRLEELRDDLRDAIDRPTMGTRVPSLHLRVARRDQPELEHRELPTRIRARRVVDALDERCGDRRPG